MSREMDKVRERERAIERKECQVSYLCPEPWCNAKGFAVTCLRYRRATNHPHLNHTETMATGSDRWEGRTVQWLFHQAKPKHVLSSLRLHFTVANFNANIGRRPA